MKGIEFDKKEACGCGSGASYGRCCQKKKVRYSRDKRGKVVRSVPLNADAIEALEQAKQDFVDAFGRTPKKRDRVFAGAFRYSPADLERAFIKAALESNAPRELVYATKTTGMILTQQNRHLVLPTDLEEWEEAIYEYRESLENGVDLLDDNGPVAQAMGIFFGFLEQSVIHLGSYADRAPRRVKRDLTTFFQFLLISRCHQCVKIVADRWAEGVSNETFSLLRTVYECTLLIGRLEAERSYAQTLLAQALAGSSSYPFRKRRGGTIDYSTIIDKNGIHYKARNSFLECARACGAGSEGLYDALYPELSSRIHFHSLEMLQEYRNTGNFLIWDDYGKERYAILVTIVLDYFLATVSCLEGATEIIRRDARFLQGKCLDTLALLFNGLDEEDREVDETLSVLAFAAMHNFQLPDEMPIEDGKSKQ